MIWLKNIFKKYRYVLLILLLSSLVIFYRYGQIPQNLSFDEVEFAKLALSLENKPYTPYSSMATGHSTLYFYIILLSFKIFGISKLALRLPAAVFGVLSPAIFYLILKNVFSQTVKKEGFLPFLFSLLFLSSRWYVNFARFSFEATFLLFLELSAIYFLFQCIKTSKRSDLVLTGIFTGLAFNSYTPGRIFFIMIAIFAIAKIHKKDIKKLLYFFVPFIAVILPLSFYLLTNRDTRFDQQFFLKNEQLSIEKKISFLEGNIKADMLMFGFEGDINGRHNYPGKRP
jgi:4-amino-4-deoxy-L-arabinose transferase-like glycosyltransferase